jgi:predicted secreted protein
MEVIDSAGRRWFHERLAAGDERWIPLPDGTTSALIWSLRSDDGQQIGGTMIAP